MGLSISINDQAAFNVVIGVPGPTGPDGPVGPAGPTFTGGAITSPLTFDAGTNSTVFENGDVYAQDNATGSYGAIYTGGLQASNGTLTLDITGAGITFGDSSFQSTAFPGSAAFYPSTGNPSGFLTAASLSGYATQSWVTSQGYATQSYVNGQGFITASALSPYLLSSTAASTYQTLAGMSGYLSKAGNLSGLSSTATARTNLGLGTMATETASNYLTVSAAASGYYPLSGNPSGFLTDAPSDGSQYARQDGAWSVVTGGGGGSYLPLAGGTMTGPIVFDGTSGQYISKGNFDTSRGGNYGISLVCSIGYEFNWQAGWLTTTNQGSPAPRPLYLDSLAGTTLRVWDSSTSLGTEVSHTGITFPDATVQTTAANPFNGGTITNPLTVLAAGVSSVEVNATGIIASDLTSSGSVGGTFDYAGLSLFASTNSFNVYPSYAETQDSSNGYYAVIYPNGVQAGDASVQTIISSGGVTFPDNSVQTTAAVSGFVPGSGDLDLMGYSVTNANFSSSAGQVSAQNVTLTYGDGGAITFADGTTQTTAATTVYPYWGGIGGTLSSQTDLQTALDSKYDANNPSGFIPEAPNDGYFYVRANGAWRQCYIYYVTDNNGTTFQAVGLYPPP